MKIPKKLWIVGLIVISANAALLGEAITLTWNGSVPLTIKTLTEQGGVVRTIPTLKPHTTSGSFDITRDKKGTFSLRLDIPNKGMIKVFNKTVKGNIVLDDGLSAEIDEWQ